MPWRFSRWSSCHAAPKRDPWTGPARGSVPSPRDADGFGDDGANGQAVSVGIDYGIRHTDVSGAFGEPSVVMRRRLDAREGGKAHSGSGTRSDRRDPASTRRPRPQPWSGPTQGRRAGPLTSDAATLAARCQRPAMADGDWLGDRRERLDSLDRPARARVCAWVIPAARYAQQSDWSRARDAAARLAALSPGNPQVQELIDRIRRRSP